MFSPLAKLASDTLLYSRYRGYLVRPAFRFFSIYSVFAYILYLRACNSSHTDDCAGCRQHASTDWTQLTIQMCGCSLSADSREHPEIERMQQQGDQAAGRFPPTRYFKGVVHAWNEAGFAMRNISGMDGNHVPCVPGPVLAQTKAPSPRAGSATRGRGRRTGFR
jgi:hypothetical protein